MSAPKPAASKLASALTRLAFDQPFFGTLLAMTPLVAQPAVATLATNGERILYNPDFLAGLTGEETVAVLAHELLHICYLHCDASRRGGRQPHKWNAACDFAINQELVRWGFRLPKGVLRSPAFEGLFAEQIYEQLPDQACSCLDELLPMPSGAKEEVQGRILTAAAAASGKLPAGLARWVAGLSRSRVPWCRILHRFLQTALAREDQSFLPPSRRHLWEDRYLPSVTQGSRPRLALAVDTSGSISPAQLEAFAAEVSSLSGLCSELLLLTCDAQVHEIIHLSEFSSRLGSLNLSGGGGTDFRPVFDRLRAANHRPDALLCLTDGNGIYPDRAPREYPVLWCISGEGRPPWGGILMLSAADSESEGLTN